MYDKFEEIVYDKNLTFYAVAKGAGVDKQILSNWKHGRSTPSFQNMARIAKFLGVSLDIFAKEVLS